VALSIRTLTEADLDAADSILIPAFGSGSRKAELGRYLSLWPAGWVLATLDGAAAGMGGAMDFGAFAYIGLMATRPEMQGQGVGRAVMLELLRRLDARGCPVALLDASRYGYPLYASLGFVEDDTVDVWVGEADRAPAREVSPVAARSLEIRALCEADLPALAAYDAGRFGADRRAALASYLADGPERALAAFSDDGGMAGFLFARLTRDDTLGPWMADGPEVAEALLRAALLRPYNALYVQMPTANASGRPLLARYGFQIGNTLRHMRRGGSPDLARRLRIYGQASFAIG
jgi:GNAT superfamily N-acetyltransferase